MKQMPSKYALPQRAIDEACNSVKEILKDEGGLIEESPHDYQCFTFKTDDVCLVFYPHRSTARNYHIRVRNQGSKNKERADRIMEKLKEGAGCNCSFTRKA